MKKIFVVVSMFLVFSGVAQAISKVTVPTVVTCQQVDGDQWVEVGIVLNDGPGLRALVVSHNVDNKSSKLVANRKVFAASKDIVTIYSDSQDTIRLSVYKGGTRLVGNLSVLQDGPGGNIHKNLNCYLRNNISFDKK